MDGQADGPENVPAPVPPGAEYLTPEQCGAILQQEPARIIKLIETGRLPAIDIGMDDVPIWLVRRDDIPVAHRPFIAPQTVAPQQPPKRRGRRRLVYLSRRYEIVKELKRLAADRKRHEGAIVAIDDRIKTLNSELNRLPEYRG
jgi:hypothetical protein